MCFRYNSSSYTNYWSYFKFVNYHSPFIDPKKSKKRTWQYVKKHAHTSAISTMSCIISHVFVRSFINIFYGLLTNFILQSGVSGFLSPRWWFSLSFVKPNILILYLFSFVHFFTKVSIFLGFIYFSNIYFFFSFTPFLFCLSFFCSLFFL